MLSYIKKAYSETRYHLDVLTGWTYLQHLRHSLHIGFWLIKIAVLGFIHGLCPWLLPSYAPKEIVKVYKQMMRLRHSDAFEK